MAYVIVKSNGTTLTTIADGTINISSTSVALPGKNYAGYGQYLDTNFVHMVENFADSTPPSNPLRGQLWYNTNNSTMYICPTDGDVNPSNWFAITTTSSGGNSTFGNITVTGNINANNVTATNNIDANSISVDYLTVNVSSTMSNANITATANISTLRTTAITTGAQSTNGTLTGVWLANGAGVANGVSGTAFYVTGGNLVIANTSARGLVTDNIYFSNGSPWTSGSGNGSGNYSNANVANYLPIYSGNILTNVTTVLTLTTGAAGTAGNIIGNWSLGVGSNLRATTVTANAQPNITSVGNLVSLAVQGNITANNGTFSNRVTAGLFSGDGGLLTNIAVSAGTSLVHGTSNVAVANNGNTTFGVAGVSNVLQVISTGIVVNTVANILGNAIVGGNANVVGNVTATNFFGQLANGLSNVSIPTAGGNINLSGGAVANVLVVTGTGVNVSGTLNAVGNANVGNLGTNGLITAVGNITAGNFVGPLANGTSNILIATNGDITVTRSGTARITATGTGVSLNGVVNVAGGNLAVANGGASRGIVADFFYYSNGTPITFGNGGGGGSSINNGTSSVNIPSSNGNVLTNIAGATITTVSTAGMNVSGNVTAGGTIGSVRIESSNPANTWISRVLFTQGGASQFEIAPVLNPVRGIYINDLGSGAVPFYANTNLSGDVRVGISNANPQHRLSVGGNGFFGGIVGATLQVQGTITGTQLISNIANGTPPLQVTSFTAVPNLNVTGSQGNITAVGNLTSLAVAGNINCNGNILANQNIVAYASSDSRLKDNIVKIENALDKIKKISGVMFDWKDGYELDRKHDTGLIAQEVEEVLPEVVVTRQDGYKAVRYEKVVGLIVQAIKELADQVEELKKR